MHQNLATATQSLVDKAIGYAEVLFHVLLWLVVNVQVQVLEVVVSLGVGLASDIQNVRDTLLDQLTRFKSTLEGSHEDSSVNLEKADITNGLLAVDIAGAEVDVREAATSDLTLLISIALTVIFLSAARLLLIDGNAAEARITLHRLQL